jgi:hypothetical protein
MKNHFLSVKKTRKRRQENTLLRGVGKEDKDYVTTFYESLFSLKDIEKNAPSSRGAILW